MKEIRLSRGLVAKVTDRDFVSLSKFKWYALSNGYAARKEPVGNGEYRTILMHRQLTCAPPGTHVDHVDHNKLNNRRSNLRVCTCGENVANGRARANNKTGFKGVSWSRVANAYHARIGHRGKSIHCGYFTSPFDAAKAYDAAAKRLFGKFSFTNKDMGLL